MPRLELSTAIRAPLDCALHLARSVDPRAGATTATGERAVSESLDRWRRHLSAPP